MAKKVKGKGKKGKAKEKQPEIPVEWVGKSVDELKLLVDQLERERDEARTSRNRAQVEHGSIQSYYDATREQIRELDMKIEKKNLEIENTIEDNATELGVYKQKANFIKYCHCNKLKDVHEVKEAQMANSATQHAMEVDGIEATKVDMVNELKDTEVRHIDEIGKLQQESKIDLAQLKEKLDSDIELFEKMCTDQHLNLQQELDSRRAAELNIVDSRKDSHLNDLIESHNRRCEDMQSYFASAERQQQIDIEDLEAEIRRLKKAAIENEYNSSYLKESNETCGKELETCSEKVVTLESKTKDKEKNSTSLRTTNARLSATRKAINAAKVQYKTLQQKFDMIEKERNKLLEGIQAATAAACTDDMHRELHLRANLASQQDSNAIIENHLNHIMSSAGLPAEKSKALQSDLDAYCMEKNAEMEKLRLATAHVRRSCSELQEKLSSVCNNIYSDRR